MKHGFVLIELIVATLVASMVAAILLAALAQGNRFQTVVDNTIDLSVRIGVASYQLEKDLMGSFVPTQAEPAKDSDKQKEEAADKGGDDKKATDKKTPEKKDAAAEQKGAEKKEVKPIEKIFYSTNKSGKFDTLTFVTNNPLVVYVGKDVGVVKPKVVRVQYSLKPEAGKKDSYALFRQESMELDLEKYKDVREYEVIGGIKNCTMTFTARIEKKDEKADKTDKPAKVLYEYKTLNEWVSEQKKDADKEKQEFPRIPYSIEIKLVLWDVQDKTEREFTIICQIPVDFTEPKKEEKKKAEQPKKDEGQPSAPADKGKGQSQKTAHNKQSNDQETVVYNGIETTIGNLDSLKRIFGHV